MSSYTTLRSAVWDSVAGLFMTRRVVELAGIFIPFFEYRGTKEMSIISVSFDDSAPILIGSLSFRRRSVPRWKGFSFRDLAVWAMKGAEM